MHTTTVVDPSGSQSLGVIIEAPDSGLSIGLTTAELANDTESNGSKGTERS